MKAYHHNSNDFIINNPINVCYEDIFFMSEEQFIEWCLEFREQVKISWLEHNQPPVRTIPDKDVVRQMERLTDMSLDGSVVMDSLTNSKDCVVMKSIIHCANGFFPNMAKMKDINTNDMEGDSLWDYFVEGKKTDRYLATMKRNFKYDSFFSYSPSLVKETEMSGNHTNGKDWIINKGSKLGDDYGYWLEPSDSNPRTIITIKGSDVAKLQDEGIVSNINFMSGSLEEFETLPKQQKYRLRTYKKNQKLFPFGMNTMKKGLVMMGVNFPPSISKWMYSNFTEELKEQDEIVIYDPSMGYGGRLLGCLSVNKDRKIHYVGTDPNTDNWIEELNMSRYEYMGRYFHNNIKRKYKTTFETHMLGSEVIHENPVYDKYKGKVDFIFTSPPYFGAEGYSEDETQSFKKFPTYEEWRDGFLTQTLKNCVGLLKPNRWMCWNISDVQFNGKYYPLERDSVEIMKSLGMEYKNRYKMVLTGPIKKNAMGKKSKLPSTKNFCSINGVYKKYEPIFCFYKSR